MNKSIGGKDFRGRELGYKHSSEQKKKFSEIRKGRKLSEETKRKLEQNIEEEYIQIKLAIICPLEQQEKFLQKNTEKKFQKEIKVENLQKNTKKNQRNAPTYKIRKSI